MKKFWLRRTRNSVNKVRRYPMYAAIIVIIALSVALTIVLIQKNRLDDLKSVSLNEMAVTAQSDVKNAMLECEKIPLPGANVKNAIHNMRIHLYAAKTMNESMITVYDFEMLDLDAYATAQSYIDAIEKQITAGRSYDEQLSQLTDAMQKLVASVDSHYSDADNSLLSNGSVK